MKQLLDDPEPDLAVVVGCERDYLGSQNRVQALLVLEVSDTTLKLDRGKKSFRYARGGVIDYWIVNLIDRRLEVYRDPQRRGARYEFTSVTLFQPGQAVAPLAALSPIPVADLLP